LGKPGSTKTMKQTLQHLFNHKTLSREEARQILFDIAEGRYNHSQTASFLTVFRMRSITVDELSGFRDALLELCVPVDLSDFNTIDMCGTGGDGKNTFNISTLASFIVAGTGQKVAKHGNRSISSKSGSADLLELAGVNLAMTPAEIKNSVETIGIGFMFAQNHHPATSRQV